MVNNRELIVKVEILKDILKVRATGGESDDNNYKSIRNELLKIPQLKPHLPIFLESCENLNDFWRFIQPEVESYKKRRLYLIEQFKPPLLFLETEPTVPSDAITSAALVDINYVHDAWEKALKRRNSDPEGAITMARTLLERVFKHILDQSGITYDDKDDLPKLYRLTSKKIEISPSPEIDELIKKILGGCQMVAVGLGELRNKLGDAHGKGETRVQPNPLYAELAVNLAGTMATFLISSWEEWKNESADVVCAEESI